MKTLRLVLGDKISASAIVALVTFVFFLQGLTGGAAQGVVAGFSAHPFDALCISHNDDGRQNTPPADAPDKMTHGMCATLCQLASNIAPALIGASIQIRAAELSSVATTPVIPKSLPRASFRRSFSEARAPPAISI